MRPMWGWIQRGLRFRLALEANMNYLHLMAFGGILFHKVSSRVGLSPGP